MNKSYESYKFLDIKSNSKSSYYYAKKGSESIKIDN